MRALLLAAALVIVADAPRAQPSASGSISGTVITTDRGKPAAAPYKVWVYLIDTDPTHKPAPDVTWSKLKISQKDLRFSEQVVAIPRGTEVEFPNLEIHETHNVFSPDPPFDLGTVKAGGTASHPFTCCGSPREAELQIYCDIHKCMWARVKVVDVLRPDFVKELKGGKYDFTNVPPGTYRVYAWTAGSTPAPSPTAIRVETGATSAGEIHLALAGFDPGDHTNKIGKPYTSTYAGCR